MYIKAHILLALRTVTSSHIAAYGKFNVHSRERERKGK